MGEFCLPSFGQKKRKRLSQSLLDKHGARTTGRNSAQKPTGCQADPKENEVQVKVQTYEASSGRPGPDATMTQNQQDKQDLMRSKHPIEGHKMLPNCMSAAELTESYCIVEDEPPATHQGAFEQSVLNKSVRLKHIETSYFRSLTEQETKLLLCEEDRFELDMVIENIQSTIRTTEKWLDDVTDVGTKRPIGDYFSASNRRCVERLYQNRGLQVLQAIQEDPAVALPLLLARLRQKAEECKTCRNEFNTLMKDILPKF